MQRYKFETNKPLAEPYNKDGVFNAYYKGYDTEKNRDVLISQYSEQRYQRIITKQKRLQKMKEVKHKNIVEIYDIFVEKENKRMFVVIQWCSGGNLYDYQKSNSTLDCDLATRILLSLMIGLKQIHKADEIHRHINMENIQFDQKGTPKLSFRCLYPKTYYMSPQDMQGTRSKQNDVFSLGVLFYKILLGQTPFKGNGLDQQIRAIQEGPKFSKDDQKMFPLSLPIQIKNLIISMTMPKSQERWADDKVIQQCQNYLRKMGKQLENQPNLPGSLMKKVFSQQFVPIFVRFTSSEEHIIIALHPNKHQFTKFHIFKSKSKSSLNDYIQKVLEPYRDVRDQMEIVPIYQNFIHEDFLVIRTFYDNQGSLKYYLDHSGTIRQDHGKTFIDKLLQKLKRYGRTHNHLTNQNILIKGGIFYINYPPFLTKDYLNSLKDAKNQVDFIAPEVKQGKTSQNADSWSIAMLKYMLQNQQMPKFDKNGKLMLNKGNRSDKDTAMYENALVKDPSKRKGLAQIDKEPIKQPEPQLQIIQAKIQTPKRKMRQKKLKAPPPQIPIPKVPKTKQKRKTIGQLLSQKLTLFHPLQKHWTKPLRVGIKCILGVFLLIFLYYWSFFLINGKLITQHSLYQTKIVDIRAFTSDAVPEIQYNLVTKTPDQTYKLFYNKTLDVLRDNYQCVLNDYSVQSDVVSVLNDRNFTAYQVFGILLTIINLIIFCFSLSKMDFPKILYISKLQQNNFNEMWNWLFINMALATQISFIYLLYGSLFHMSLEPCLQKPSLTAVQFLFKQWNFSFNIRYIWIYLGLVFSYIVIIFFIIKPQFIVNRFLKAFLVALYLAGTLCRIMGGSGGIIATQKQSVFGKAGELLLFIISVLFIVLDLIFGCCIQRSQNYDNKKNRVNDDSAASAMNPTEQNFLPE